MLITAWKDKRLLHVLSTNSTSQNTSVTRKQKDGSMKEVPCPDVIQSYNKFMSGVDHADQLRASYCTSCKGMKWWKYLFYFLFDICIVNAFILMKESPNHQLKTKSGRHRDLTQLEFCMKLAHEMLKGFTSKRKRSSHAEGESSADQHYPIIMPGRKRCRMCSLKKKRAEPFPGCEQCKINLCVKCFKPYHKRKHHLLSANQVQQ